MRIKCIVFCLFTSLMAQAQTIQLINTPVMDGLRGLFVLNDTVWWASGQRNTVISTEDGGKTWNKFTVGDTAMKTDFRDIQVLSKHVVIVAGAGHPAYIYKTYDGGVNWKKVYENQDTAVFIDGIDFWDYRNGIALADPINNTWQLLATNNAGDSWETFPADILPSANPGEAAFAASGTAIRTFGDNQVVFVTGGADKARVIISNDRGNTWSPQVSSLKASQSSGLFSVERNSKGSFVCLGGDYLQQGDSLANVAILQGAPYKTKSLSRAFPRGYRCAVAYAGDRILVATGDNGTDISHDDGNSWKPLSDQGFYTVSCYNKTCVFSGKNGRIGVLRNISR